MTQKKDNVPAAPDPTAPGGAEFDVDNATPEDFDKHSEILRRRSVVAGYTPQALTVQTSEAQPATEQPTPTGDIRAVNGAGEVRYFNQPTWDAMEEKGAHAGWEVSVAEPSKDL